MNNRFFELPKEKQDRFINAALQIFAKNGYKKASTDEIVKAERKGGERKAEKRS